MKLKLKLMKKALKLIGLVIFVLAGILIFKTLSLNSKQVVSYKLETIKFPNDIYKNLSNAIKYQTIS